VSKKILITGANGQIANSLKLFFEDKDFNVRYTSLSPSVNNPLCLDLSLTDKCAYLFDNYTPDFIINTAGYTNVDLCEDNREKAHNVNVGILKNILKFMSKKTKLIHISSDYIFDGKNALYKEDSIPNPINYYGKTKLESENLIRSSNRKYIILRTGNLYSQFTNLKSNRLSWIFNKLSNNESIYAVEDMFSKPTNTCTIPPIILSLLPISDNLIINYAGQDSLSIYDFAVLVSQVFDFEKNLINKCKLKDMDFKAERPKDVSLSTDFISEIINCNIYETEYCLKSIKSKLI
tara:strand:- start:1366 stop:2241 length:876 start_codon:yes stop_codon:yes gene_type:complete